MSKNNIVFKTKIISARLFIKSRQGLAYGNLISVKEWVLVFTQRDFIENWSQVESNYRIRLMSPRFTTKLWDLLDGPYGTWTLNQVIKSHVLYHWAKGPKIWGMQGSHLLLRVMSPLCTTTLTPRPINTSSFPFGYHYYLFLYLFIIMQKKNIYGE